MARVIKRNILDAWSKCHFPKWNEFQGIAPSSKNVTVWKNYYYYFFFVCINNVYIYYLSLFYWTRSDNLYHCSSLMYSSYNALLPSHHNAARKNSFHLAFLTSLHLAF